MLKEVVEMVLSGFIELVDMVTCKRTREKDALIGLAFDSLHMRQSQRKSKTIFYVCHCSIKERPTDLSPQKTQNKA